MHGGLRYFLLLVDDCSHYMCLQLLASKDKVAAASRPSKLKQRWSRGGGFKC
jgi:hypothetical protein